ncbi:MAG: adenosylcobinamide-GDP ribazoletransferase [Nocardioides sp.]
MRRRPGDRAVNAVRLAVGTLSVLPVRAPVVDRAVAGRAMVLAPLVGLLLWVPVGGLLWAAGELDLAPLLSAALAVGLLALLTRGMHLDGLADTADGLGSGRPAQSALEVMRRGDTGPFGVVTLLLVLLVQVAALGQLVGSGLGPAAVGAALVVSRLVLPLACLRGIPAARADGLGSAVAGSVSRSMALLAVLLGGAALTALTLGTGSTPEVAALALLGLLPGAALGARAVRRLGGVTGDVLGACVEATFTAALVAACLV